MDSPYPCLCIVFSVSFVCTVFSVFSVFSIPEQSGPKRTVSAPSRIRFSTEERIFPEFARGHPEVLPETAAEIGNGGESRPKRGLFNRTAVQQKRLGMSETDRIEEMHGGTSCGFPEKIGKTARRKSRIFRKIGAAERFGETFLHVFHDPFHFRIPSSLEIQSGQQIGQCGEHEFQSERDPV